MQIPKKLLELDRNNCLYVSFEDGSWFKVWRDFIGDRTPYFLAAHDGKVGVSVDTRIPFSWGWWKQYESEERDQLILAMRAIADLRKWRIVHD